MTTSCTFVGCSRPHRARGYCTTHYARWRKHGDAAVVNRSMVRGLCSVEGCERPHCARGWCGTHYQRWLTHGDVLANKRPHKRAPGAGSISTQGYLVHKINGRQVAEHRTVMETMLGRPLRRNEEVHHRNGVKLDNRPDNLELWVHSQPAGQRPSDLVVWARAILALYGAEVDRMAAA